MGWLESKGLDLCARDKAWMTRAGDHGRKGVPGLETWKRGMGLRHGLEAWAWHGLEAWA